MRKVDMDKYNWDEIALDIVKDQEMLREWERLNIITEMKKEKGESYESKGK
jgi:hypothetical protein